MNIIKFNSSVDEISIENTELQKLVWDMYLDNPDNYWEVQDYVNWFFKNLKGKYAYLIHMRYIVPFSELSEDKYIEGEQDISSIIGMSFAQNGEQMYNGDCLKKDLIKRPIEYIDILGKVGKWIFNTGINTEFFEEQNSSSSYEKENSLIENWGFIEEDAKDFRTWLATTLLEIGEDILSDEEIMMLTFYKNGMYDSTLSSVLSLLEKGGSSISSSSTCNCSCTSSTLSSLYGTGTSCDFSSLYTTAMYNIMYSTFSERDFWTQFSTSFLEAFRNRIGYIIESEWTVSCSSSSSNTSSIYTDCTCTSNSSTTSTQSCVLENLLKALNYMIDDEDGICGHKNFIFTALSNFAQIYPCLSWI